MQFDDLYFFSDETALANTTRYLAGNIAKLSVNTQRKCTLHIVCIEVYLRRNINANAGIRNVLFEISQDVTLLFKDAKYIVMIDFICAKHYWCFRFNARYWDITTQEECTFLRVQKLIRSARLNNFSE